MFYRHGVASKLKVSALMAPTNIEHPQSGGARDRPEGNESQPAGSKDEAAADNEERSQESVIPDLELRDKGSLEKRGPHHIKYDVADADKVVRTGGTDERPRDTPPAGRWNDTSAD